MVPARKVPARKAPAAAPWLLAAGAIGVLVGGSLLWRMLTGPGSAPDTAAPQDAASPTPAPSPGARVSEAQKLIESDPERALPLLEELKASANPADREAAQAGLPRALQRIYTTRAGAGKHEEAQAALRKLIETAPDAPETRSVREDWSRRRAEWAEQLVRAHDWPAAERLLGEMVADPRYYSAGGAGRSPVQVYGNLRFEEALAAEKAGTPMAASDAFRMSAEAMAASQDGGVVADHLAAKYGPDTLIEAGGSALEGGRHAVALAYFRAAQRANRAPNVTGTPEAEAYERRKNAAADGIASCQLALARATAEGSFHWLPLDDAVNACAQVGQYARERLDLDERKGVPGTRERWLDRRASAARISIALRLLRARRLFEERSLSEADQALDYVFKVDAPILIEVKAAAPGFDPWSAAPPEIAARITREYPDFDEARRQERLRHYAGQGAYRPRLPETAAALALLADVRLAWGASLLPSRSPDDRDKGKDLLRDALRERAGEESAARAAETLRQMLRRAGDQQDFDSLLDLAGFYVAEVGPPGSVDPFRGELRSRLAAATAHFAQRAPIKRLFLLTLVAEAFAGEPDGEAARKEAQEKAFEVVSRAQPQEIPRTAAGPPSGLGGYSVHRVENGTRDHLLLFYDGPERFFVRLSPVRRGCVVLRDGTYTMAAVVTSEQVRPNRGARTFGSEVFPSKYVVTHSGEGREWSDSATPYGNFLLLRAPAGSGPFKVASDTGAVSAGP